jgi:hypothetical protein
MIYFDEAGNSGGNLLDENQPAFTLVSHNFVEEEVKTLLEPILKLSQASELHFTQLKKYNKFRNAILDCINHELITKDRLYYYIAHKRFMISVQIVDQLIEPVFYERGEDLYQYGQNLSTANILHIMGTVVWKKDLYEKMCVQFVKWMRSGKLEDITHFYEAVRELYHSLKHKKDKWLISLIMASIEHIRSITDNLDKYTLYATLSCFNAHCHHWADIYKAPFDITFDNSKQIEYWRDMIDFMTHNLPEAEVGYGSRKHKYPLLINSLVTADSQTNLPLQLADLFASSLNYAAVYSIRGTTDDFAKDILESKLFNIPGNSMWPDTAMTPEELDMTDPVGINALDFIADAALKNPEAYSKKKRPN